MDEKDSNLLDVIRELKKREPFSPFMIVLTSGDRHVIESEELMVITPSQIIYAYPKSDRVVFMRINQIASVEQIEKKPAA